MTVKDISAFLVVDWRDEKLKVRKTRPETSPYEVAVPLDLEIEVPEVDVESLSARLQVPQAHVHKIVQGEVHEEDLQDWQVVAEEVIEEKKPLEGPAHTDDGLVDQLLGRVMTQAPGVPDPDGVRAYLQDRLEEVSDPTNPR